MAEKALQDPGFKPNPRASVYLCGKTASKAMLENTEEFSYLSIAEKDSQTFDNRLSAIKEHSYPSKTFQNMVSLNQARALMTSRERKQDLS